MKYNISFIVNEVSGGWDPDDVRLGGTEESVVEWASRIAEKGHQVTVYNSPKVFVGKYRNVEYIPRDSIKSADITINVKSVDVPPLNRTFYLTNEMNAGSYDLSKYSGVILPSKWALDHLGINHQNIQILPHGYDDTKIYPGKKITNQCLYASSPDRGLEELLDLWPQVVERVPDASLIVTYGGNIDVPNVMNLGEVDEDTMNELFNTSEFWLHPALGGELYCITGVKAQAAHTIPVYYPTMALPETVRWGIRVHRDTFVNKLVTAMQSSRYKNELVRHAVVQENITPYPTWDSTTDSLLEIIGIRPWE